MRAGPPLGCNLIRILLGPPPGWRPGHSSASRCAHCRRDAEKLEGLLDRRALSRALELAQQHAVLLTITPWPRAARRGWSCEDALDAISRAFLVPGDWGGWASLRSLPARRREAGGPPRPSRVASTRARSTACGPIDHHTLAACRAARLVLRGCPRRDHRAQGGYGCSTCSFVAVRSTATRGPGRCGKRRGDRGRGGSRGARVRGEESR